MHPRRPPTRLQTRTRTRHLPTVIRTPLPLPDAVAGAVPVAEVSPGLDMIRPALARPLVDLVHARQIRNTDPRDARYRLLHVVVPLHRDPERHPAAARPRHRRDVAMYPPLVALRMGRDTMIVPRASGRGRCQCRLPGKGLRLPGVPSHLGDHPHLDVTHLPGAMMVILTVDVAMMDTYVRGVIRTARGMTGPGTMGTVVGKKKK